MAQEPVDARAFVELDVKAEAGLRGGVQTVGEEAARVVRAAVAVGGENKAAAVPGFGSVVRDPGSWAISCHPAR